MRSAAYKCLGFPLWCSKRRAARCVGKLARWRVGRWPWLGLGWPESTAASSAAAAGVRSCTETWLELEGERSKALGMLYGALRTCWTRRGDQMVTGAASTASSATAEVRPWWETELRRGNEGEKRGKRWRSSPRLQRASKRARGRTGDGESTAMVVGARGGRRWRRRLHRASGVLWLDGELQGEGAELLRESGRRGEAGGGGYGERRRWVRSDTGERERGRGEEEPGESERVRGGRGVVPGHPDEEGRGRQAGELVAWRGGARARRAHSPPSVEDEDDRGGRRAGPPAGWAGQLAGLHREEPR